MLLMLRKPKKKIEKTSRKNRSSSKQNKLTLVPELAASLAWSNIYMLRHLSNNFYS